MPDRSGAIAGAIEALLNRRSPLPRAEADVLVGLIGRGIQLSRTPTMHEREAARLGLSCRYVLVDFDELGLDNDDLEVVLDAVARMGFRGLNVTYPFKQAIMPLLDDIAAEAEAIGAVNTVVFGDRSAGHNTDYWGFAESFRSQMDGVALDRVAVFGAGGAGSAVCAALAGLGAAEIWLIDPETEPSRELAARLGRTSRASFVAAADSAAAVRAATGIVNTTPVGMAKHPGTPFATAWLRPDQWVADIIYFPEETELLRNARALGCRTLPGIGMAIGQAARAFEHFTGREADVGSMAKHFEAAA